MKDIAEVVLIGAGGHASEVLSYVADLQRSGMHLDIVGVLDDGRSPGKWETVQILGQVSAPEIASIRHEGALGYIVCIGNNAIRQALALRLEPLSDRIKPWTLIHPSAYVGRAVEIGPGCLLAPQTIVTTRSTIGQHCILNAKSSVHHDCVIGDYVNINPGATVCGNVTIGDGAFIGAGATVKNGVVIGSKSVVGAGAVVVSDVPDNLTVVGVPARPIKRDCQ